MPPTPAWPPAPPAPAAGSTPAEPRPGWAELAGYLGVGVAGLELLVSPLAALYAGGSVIDPLRPVLPGWMVAVVALAAAAAAVALPVLQLVGGIRLLDRRGRRLLVWGGLPVTVFWVVTTALTVVGLQSAPWFLLVLLLPFALPPVPALMPSVRRWLATAPRGGRGG